jgi:hypothetical protein
VKVEIKLDPEDMEEIAQRLADIILRSFLEVESRIKPRQPPAERPLPEKTWKIPDGEWWSEKEVSRVANISIQTLRNWRFAGKGPTYQKVGRRVVYQRSDVLEFMNSFPKVKRRD